MLTMRLRVLPRMEFVVRRGLAAGGGKLAGLYAGNPKRATPSSTAECLLKAFQELMLTVMQEGRKRRCHLTPLSSLQQRILTLMNCPVDICTRLGADLYKPP